MSPKCHKPELGFSHSRGVSKCIFHALPDMARNFYAVSAWPRHERNLVMPDFATHSRDCIAECQDRFWIPCGGRTTPIEGGLGATIDGRLRERSVLTHAGRACRRARGPQDQAYGGPSGPGLDRPCARRRMEWAAGMKEGRRKCSAGAEPRKCQWIEHHAPADFPLPLPARFRVLGKRKRELGCRERTFREIRRSHSRSRVR